MPRARVAFVRPFLVDSGTHEIGHAHSGDLDRILKTKEDIFTRTHLGFHCQQIFATQIDLAGSHFVGRISREYRRERRFASSIGSHDCVYFALIDDEVHSFQNLFSADRSVKIFYFK